MEKLLREQELWPKGWAPHLIDDGCWMVECGQSAQSAQLARHFFNWVSWKPEALVSIATTKVPYSMLAPNGADHESHDALAEFLRFLGLLKLKTAHTQKCSGQH